MGKLVCVGLTFIVMRTPFVLPTSSFCGCALNKEVTVDRPGAVQQAVGANHSHLCSPYDALHNVNLLMTFLYKPEA